MTGKIGRVAIKKLISFLAVICAIALGAVWMILSPAHVASPAKEESAKQPLAYEKAIAHVRQEEAKANKDAKANGDAGKKADIPPFETVMTAPRPDAATADSSNDQNAIQDLSSDAEDTASQDATALPDESANAQDGADSSQSSQDRTSRDMAALPNRQPGSYDGVPPMPGEEGAASDQYGADGAEQWGDRRGAPDAYGSPPQYDAYGRPLRRPPPGDPYGPPDQGASYGQGGPYGAQQADQGNGQNAPGLADQNAEEWVEVVISGAPMRADASEDAAMLFAFPYGRNLKVVSRYEGWVEVADPKSGATGWMQAGMLAPTRANRDPYGQNEAYYDDGPRRGPGGWFRRGADEFSHMLNRAFGGGGY
jgi:hypothetical protein